MQRQPAHTEHDHDCQEHPRRVRSSAPLSRSSSGCWLREADHGLTTSRAQEAQDEDVHGGDDRERDDVGEREERQEQTRPVHLSRITSHMLHYSAVGKYVQYINSRWRGVVRNAFRLKRSYSTPGPVSAAMGDCLQAGTAIGFRASHEH